MAFVVDASVALLWVLPGEQTDETRALFDRLVQENALAPAIWPLETANSLRSALRRGRINDDALWRLANELLALPIEIVQSGLPAALKGPLEAAVQLGISVYDAAYLDLARQRQIPLATLDRRLRQACAELNIPTLPSDV